jgi:hypothetical protein
MTLVSGREREARKIRQANRAAAVGRLLLGEFNDWHDFLQADVVDLENLPRRQLKSGQADVRERLSLEIRGFCARNFRGMNEQKLSRLYEEIKAFRGLELPLIEFEQRFAPIKQEVLKSHPKHTTVWGLQFKCPEEEITKDLTEALQIVTESQAELTEYETEAHSKLRYKRDSISLLSRRKIFAARSVVTSCFNLMEAYLNGLAWDYVQTHSTVHLSNRRKKLLEDTMSISFRDKIFKYPEILAGHPLWQEPNQELEEFVNILKPFRDSLVHPSPFSVPEKFGGYDKLRLFYRVDYDTAILAVNLLITLIRQIHLHIFGSKQVMPIWLNDLEDNVVGLGK